jgi:hypothetical protein
MRRDPEFGNIVPGVFTPLIAIEPLVWAPIPRFTLRRERTMRFYPHGEVVLDGEVGGAAGARPSSSAKKLSSAPVLLTR